MIATPAYTREQSRLSFLKLEVLLIAVLILLVALPAFGFIAKATTSHVDCVRGAFQHVVTQTCK